jgi:ribosome hibernation promoting factor
VNIETRTRGFSLTPGLRAHVERRLELALDRYAERVARVRVVVSDVNGPRGGEDKACRVEVRLRGGGAVRAAAADADAYAAICAAAHRAARALARAVQRERATTLELLWLAGALSRPPSAA